MLKSDIIFWSTMFFVASWIIGFFIGIEAMFICWFVWLIAIIGIGCVTLYFKFLQGFD